MGAALGAQYAGGAPPNNPDNAPNNANNRNFVLSLGPRRPNAEGDNNLLANLTPYFPFGRLNVPPLHQTSTIRSLVSLSKETVHLNREENNMYQLQFKFDALEPCYVRVFFIATETLDENKKLVIQGKSEYGPVHFEKGFGQLFVQSDWTKFEPNIEATVLAPEYPVIIKIQSEKDDEERSDVITAQTTFANLLSCADGSYAIKVVRQKVYYRGQGYVAHDIFGLDHTGERESEGSRECVVCMSDPRDTTVLPCRHLCLCAPCAELMRTQTNKCPICRSHVSSLLQITISSQQHAKQSDEKDAKIDVHKDTYTMPLQSDPEETVELTEVKIHKEEDETIGSDADSDTPIIPKDSNSTKIDLNTSMEGQLDKKETLSSCSSSSSSTKDFEEEEEGTLLSRRGKDRGKDNNAPNG